MTIVCLCACVYVSICSCGFISSTNQDRMVPGEVPASLSGPLWRNASTESRTVKGNDGIRVVMSQERKTTHAADRGAIGSVGGDVILNYLPSSRIYQFYMCSYRFAIAHIESHSLLSFLLTCHATLTSQRGSAPDRPNLKRKKNYLPYCFFPSIR